MKKTEVHSIDSGVLARAQGCLLGQLAGDALGSLVEFRSEEEILREYPDGVRDLADGGRWNTIAGQPTDDSDQRTMRGSSLGELKSAQERRPDAGTNGPDCSRKPASTSPPRNAAKGCMSSFTLADSSASM